MSSVTFSIHCHTGDKEQLYSNFEKIVKSHNHNFDRIQIIHQRCEPELDKLPDLGRTCFTYQITNEDYDPVFRKFRIPLVDEYADKITHGPTSAHFWKNHCVNHFCGLLCADTKYIIFSDSDCVMIRNEPQSWIEEGINILEANPEVLIVCPSEGAPGLNQNMSQQLFLCDRVRLMNIDWNCWDGKFIEGGQFAEWFVMCEGRVGNYMMKNNLWRCVLPDNWRYYHDWVHHKQPEELYKLALKALGKDV